MEAGQSADTVAVEVYGGESEAEPWLAPMEASIDTQDAVFDGYEFDALDQWEFRESRSHTLAPVGESRRHYVLMCLLVRWVSSHLEPDR